MLKILDKKSIKEIQRVGFTEDLLDVYTVPTNLLPMFDFTLDEFCIIEKFIGRRIDGIEYESISNSEAIINGLYIKADIVKGKEITKVTIGDKVMSVNTLLLTTMLEINMELDRHEALVKIYLERESVIEWSKEKGGCYIIYTIDARESLSKALYRTLIVQEKRNKQVDIRCNKMDYLLDCNQHNLNLESGSFYCIHPDGAYIAGTSEHDVITSTLGMTCEGVERVGIVGSDYAFVESMDLPLKDLQYLFNLSKYDLTVLERDIPSPELFKVKCKMATLCMNKPYMNFKFFKLYGENFETKKLKTKK